MSYSIPALDHIVFAVPLLEEWCDFFERRTGILPSPGGVHPGWGTRNAIVSLGPRTYLEIIAPDFNQNVPRLALGVTPSGPPRVTTWAVVVPELNLEDESPLLGGILAMQRVRQDGSTLQWRLSDPFADRMSGIVPFQIDWRDSPHPASTIEQNCRLRRFALRHPDPRAVERAIRSLGYEIQVEHADRPGIRVEIATPGGLVTL